MSARERFDDRYPPYAWKRLIPGASMRFYKRRSAQKERRAVDEFLRRGREIPPRHRSIPWEAL